MHITSVSHILSTLSSTYWFFPFFYDFKWVKSWVVAELGAVHSFAQPILAALSHKHSDKGAACEQLLLDTRNQTMIMRHRKDRRWLFPAEKTAGRIQSGALYSMLLLLL